MISKCSVLAPAKINLSLDITGIRSDGYHLLETVMQTISLYDVVHVSIEICNTSDVTEIFVTGSDPLMPTDGRNTAYRAAAAFAEKIRTVTTGSAVLISSIHIHIDKNIPREAGLAGGSADAAGTLWALNYLCGDVIKRDDLLAIAVGIGADVPFCLTGGTAFCTGIGEVIRPLPEFSGQKIVLIKPVFGVSTAAAFKAIDSNRRLKRPDTPALIKALEDNSAQKVMQAGGNVFEGYVSSCEPEIAEIIESLRSAEGCAGASMSGSGPTVFGVFADEAKAKNAIVRLQIKYSGRGYFFAFAETFPSGPELKN